LHIQQSAELHLVVSSQAIVSSPSFPLAGLQALSLIRSTQVKIESGMP